MSDKLFRLSQQDKDAILNEGGSDIENYTFNRKIDKNPNNYDWNKIEKEIQANYEETEPEPIFGRKWKRTPLVNKDGSLYDFSYVGGWTSEREVWNVFNINSRESDNKDSRYNIIYSSNQDKDSGKGIYNEERTLTTYLDKTVVTPTRSITVPLKENRNIAAGLPISKTSDFIINRANNVTSYNSKTNSADFVSWKLTKQDIGFASRKGINFSADTSLSTTDYTKESTDVIDRNINTDRNEFYKKSGFDKGHIIPNADRNANKELQAETFLFTNVLPQSPENNRGPWEKFESYTRKAAKDGKEVYIIAGGIGTGGRGSNGYKETIGDINIPSATWKVTLTVKAGGSPTNPKDILDSAAIITPNIQGIGNTDWKAYKTSIANIEKLTGLTLFDKAKGLDKLKGDGRTAISFDGYLDYANTPVNYIPYLNELRLIDISKSEKRNEYKPNTDDPNRISYRSWGEVGRKSDEDTNIEVAYASLAFNPLKLSDAYYKDFNLDINPPRIQIYEDLYRFTTGITERSQLPNAVRKLDDEINYMGLGHRLNRLIKQDLYQSGLGPGGTLLRFAGKLIDDATGQNASIEAKHIEKRDRTGGLKKVLSFQQYAANDEDQKGLFEGILTNAYKTLEGAAVATVSYVFINKTYQHILAGIEAKSVNSLLEQEVASSNGAFKPSGLKHMQRVFTFGTSFANTFRDTLIEAHNQGLSDEGFTRRLAQNLDRVNVYNAVATDDGKIIKASLNDIGFINTIARNRMMDATNLQNLVVPIFQLINPYQWNSDYDKSFNSALKSVITQAQQVPQLSVASGGSADFKYRSRAIVTNIGEARIRAVAKSWDNLAQYLPANLAYWVPSLREGLKLKQFDPTKDLTIRDIVSFESLTIHTQHYLNQASNLFINPSKAFKEAGSYLKDLSKLHRVTKDLTEAEKTLIIGLNGRGQNFTSSSAMIGSGEDHIVAANMKARQNYNKGTQYARQFMRDNAGYVDILKQQNELIRRLDLSSKFNPHERAEVSLKAASSLEEKQVKGARKFMLGAGVFLLANKFLDDYLFSSPGASLPTQLEAFFGLKASADINDPNDKSLRVARYKFTDVVPAHLMFAIAGLSAFTFGTIFPKITDVTARSATSGYNQLKNVETTNGLRSVGDVIDDIHGIHIDGLNEYSSPSSSAKISESERKLQEAKQTYKKTSNSLLDVQLRRNTVKFNTSAALVGAVASVITTKLLFAGVAFLANSLFNQDNGVQYKDTEAINIAYLNRLSSSKLITAKTGKDYADLATGISLSELLSYKSKDGQRTYTTASQITNPFFQVALVNQIKSNTKLGGKDNEDAGYAAFGVSFQLIPISGLGFTLMSPIGVRLKESKYKNLEGTLAEEMDKSKQNLDLIPYIGYSAVNLLTFGQKAKNIQFAYISGNGFDQLATATAATYATSLAFDYLHSNARPFLEKRFKEGSRILKEYDALMQHTKAARHITYASYRVASNTLAGMAYLPAMTIGATGQGIKAFFSNNITTAETVGEVGLKAYQNSNAAKYRRKAGNIIKTALAYFIPITVARIMADPANGYVGQGYADPKYQFSATMQIGLLYGSLLKYSGVLASGEQLAADFRKATANMTGDQVKGMWGYRPANEINNITDEILEAGRIHNASYNNKGFNRRFTPKAVLMRMAAPTLYKDGWARQVARGVEVTAPKDMRFGKIISATERIKYGFLIGAGMVLASKAITSFMGDQDLDNFYRNNPFAPAVRLLAGIETKRSLVDQTGFNQGITNAERRQGLGNVVSYVSSAMTMGLLDLGKALGLYADTANPFISVGPFGASFKRNQNTGYIQFASTSRDISASAFDLVKDTSNMDELMNTIRLLRGTSTNNLSVYLAKLRGRTPRKSQMKIKAITNSAMQALGNSKGLSTELYRRQLRSEHLSWQSAGELWLDMKTELAPWTHGVSAASSNIQLMKTYGKYASHLFNPLAFMGEGAMLLDYPSASSNKDDKKFFLNIPQGQGTDENSMVSPQTSITPMSVISSFAQFGLFGKMVGLGLFTFSALTFLKFGTDVLGSLAAIGFKKDALSLYNESRIHTLFSMNRYEYGITTDDAGRYIYQKIKGSKGDFRLPGLTDKIQDDLIRAARLNQPSGEATLATSIGRKHKALLKRLGDHFMSEKGLFSNRLDEFLTVSGQTQTGNVLIEKTQKLSSIRNQMKTDLNQLIKTKNLNKKIFVRSDVTLYQALYQHSMKAYGDDVSHLDDFMTHRINPLVEKVMDDVTSHITDLQVKGVTDKNILKLHAYSFLQKSNEFNELLSTLKQPVSAEQDPVSNKSKSFKELNKAEQQLVNSIIEKPWSQSATSTFIKGIGQATHYVAGWVGVGKPLYEAAESATILLSGTENSTLRLTASRSLVNAGVYGTQAILLSKLITALGAKNPLLNGALSIAAFAGLEMFKGSQKSIMLTQERMTNAIGNTINYLTKPLTAITKWVANPIDKVFRFLAAPYLADTFHNIGKVNPVKQFFYDFILPKTAYTGEYEYRLGETSFANPEQTYIFGNANLYLKNEFQAELMQAQSHDTGISKKYIHGNLIGQAVGQKDEVLEETIFKSYDGTSRVSENFSIGNTYKISNLMRAELKRRQRLYESTVLGGALSRAEWNILNQDTLGYFMMTRIPFGHTIKTAASVSAHIADKWLALKGRAGAGFNAVKASIKDYIKANNSQQREMFVNKTTAPFNKLKENLSWDYQKSKYYNQRWEMIGVNFNNKINAMRQSISLMKETTIKWGGGVLRQIQTSVSKRFDKIGYKTTNWMLSSLGKTFSYIGNKLTRSVSAPSNNINRLGFLSKIGSSVLSFGNYIAIGLFNISKKLLTNTYTGLVNLNKKYANRLNGGIAGGSTYSAVDPLIAYNKRWTVKGALGNLKTMKDASLEALSKAKTYLDKFGITGKFVNASFMAFDTINAIRIDKGIERINQSVQIRRDYTSTYGAYGATFGALSAIATVGTVNNVMARSAASSGKFAKFAKNPFVFFGAIIGASILGSKLGIQYGDDRFFEDYNSYKKNGEKEKDPFYRIKDIALAGLAGTLFQIPHIVSKSFTLRNGKMRFSWGKFATRAAGMAAFNTVFSAGTSFGLGMGAATNATILSYWGGWEVKKPGSKFGSNINGPAPKTSRFPNMPPVPSSHNPINRAGNLSTKPNTFAYGNFSVDIDGVKSYIKGLYKGDVVSDLINLRNDEMILRTTGGMSGSYDGRLQFDGGVVNTIDAKLKGSAVNGKVLADAYDTIFHEGFHTTHINGYTTSSREWTMMGKQGYISSDPIKRFQRELIRSLVGQGTNYGFGEGLDLDQKLSKSVRTRMMDLSKESVLTFIDNNKTGINSTVMKDVLLMEMQANIYAYKKTLQLAKANPHLGIDISAFEDQVSDAANIRRRYKSALKSNIDANGIDAPNQLFKGQSAPKNNIVNFNRRAGQLATGLFTSFQLATRIGTTTNYNNINYRKATQKEVDNLSQAAALDVSTEVGIQIGNIFTNSLAAKIAIGAFAQASVTGDVFGINPFGLLSNIKDPIGLVEKYKKNQQQQYRQGHAIYDPLGAGNNVRLLKTTDVLQHSFNLWREVDDVKIGIKELFKSNRYVAGLSKASTGFVTSTKRVLQPLSASKKFFEKQFHRISSSLGKAGDMIASKTTSAILKANTKMIGVPVLNRVSQTVTTNYIKYGLKATVLDVIAPAIDIYNIGAGSTSFISRDNQTIRELESSYAQTATALGSLKGSIIGAASLGVAGDITGGLIGNFSSQAGIQENIRYRKRAGDLDTGFGRAATLLEDIYNNSATRTTLGAQLGIATVGKIGQAWKSYDAARAAKVGIDNVNFIQKIGRSANIARLTQAEGVVANLAKYSSQITSKVAPVVSPLLKVAGKAVKILDVGINLGLMAYGSYKISKLTNKSSKEQVHSAYNTTYKSGGALVGTAVGAALGSVGGPVGIAIGALAGSFIGEFAGGVFGKYFADKQLRRRGDAVNNDSRIQMGLMSVLAGPLGLAVFGMDILLEEGVNKFFPSKSAVDAEKAKSIQSKGKVNTNKFDLLNFLTGASTASAATLETQAIITSNKLQNIQQTSVITKSERTSEQIAKQMDKNQQKPWWQGISDFFQSGYNIVRQGLKSALDLSKKVVRNVRDFFTAKAKSVPSNMQKDENYIDYTPLTNLSGYDTTVKLKQIVEASRKNSKYIERNSGGPVVSDVTSLTGKDEVGPNGLKRGGNDLTSEQVAKLTPLGKQLYAVRNNKYLLALSDVIARSEGTDFQPGSKNFGYDMIIGGTNVGMSVMNQGHPFVEGGLNYRHNSSASGRYQYMDFNYKSKPGDPSDLVKLLNWGNGTPGSLSAGVQDLGFVGALYKRLGAKRFNELIAGNTKGLFTDTFVGGRLNQEYASLQGNPYGQGTAHGKLSETNRFFQERLKARDRGFVSNSLQVVGNLIGGNKPADTVPVPSLTSTPAPLTKPTINAEAIARQYGLQSLAITDIRGNAIADYNKKKPPRHPASTIKLVVADLAIGLIDPNKTYVVGKESVAIGEDKYFAGTRLTGAQLIRNSLRDSDNTSNNTLIQIMGGEDAVTKLARSKGYATASIARLSVPNASQFRNVASADDVTKAMVSIMNNNTSLGKVGQAALSDSARFNNSDHRAFGITGEIASKIGNNSKVIGNTSIVEVGGNKYIITAFIDSNKYKAGQADTPESRRDIRNASNQVVSLLGTSSGNTIMNATKPNTIGVSKAFLASPFVGKTLADMANYNPLPVQGFFALRDGGKRVHRKIDYDYRINSGEGASVLSMTDGKARLITNFFKGRYNSAAVEVTSRNPITGEILVFTYGHMETSSVLAAFGGKQEITVKQGQLIAKVRDERIAGILNHTDLKLTVNGKVVNVQDYVSKYVRQYPQLAKIKGGETSPGVIAGTGALNQNIAGSNVQTNREIINYYDSVKAGNLDIDVDRVMGANSSLVIKRVDKNATVTLVNGKNQTQSSKAISNTTDISLNGVNYSITVMGKDRSAVQRSTYDAIRNLRTTTAVGLASTTENGVVTFEQKIKSAGMFDTRLFDSLDRPENVQPITEALKKRNLGFGDFSEQAAGVGNFIRTTGLLLTETRPVGISIQNLNANETRAAYKKAVDPRVSPYITSGIGFRPSYGRDHRGIDVAFPRSANAVLRSPYELARIDYNYNAGAAGNVAAIIEIDPVTRQPTGRIAASFHLRDGSSMVKQGAIVTAGTGIAIQGDTGVDSRGRKVSSGDHFHFEEYIGVPANQTGIASRGKYRVTPSVELINSLTLGALNKPTQALGNRRTESKPQTSCKYCNKSHSTTDHLLGTTKKRIANKESFVLVTRSGQTDSEGMEILDYQVYNAGKLQSKFQGRSGRPNTQLFRANSKEGSEEPFPPGNYNIGSLQTDYRTVSNPAIGSTGFLPFTPNFNTARNNGGFHYDAGSPGSSGCFVFLQKGDFRRFQQELKKFGINKMIVDWSPPVRQRDNTQASLPAGRLPAINLDVKYQAQVISGKQLENIAEVALNIKAAAKQKLKEIETKKTLTIPEVNIAKTSKNDSNYGADKTQPPQKQTTYDASIEVADNKLVVNISEPTADLYSKWHLIQGGAMPTDDYLSNGGTHTA